MHITTHFPRFLSLARFCLGLLLLGWPLVAEAQRQAEIWHFGENIVITFLEGEAALINPSEMETAEGCVSYCDADGQLLFYTNGGGRIPELSGNQNPGTIWNRNHEVMYNMNGREGGGFSAFQSSIAFPVPGQEEGQFYLFTMEETEFDAGGAVPDQPQGRGLSYFIIDRSLNGGLGGVSLADQRVFVPSYEALSATPIAGDAAGGHWVLCLDGNTNNAFIVLPVTTAGLGEISSQSSSVALEGQIKISPNGQFLFNNRYVFRFDPESGSITPEPLVDLGNVNGLTTSFTNDSRYIFTVRTQNSIRQLVRFDLAADDILASASILANFGVGFTYQMQLASNGNLYFLDFDEASRDFGLSEIRCPTTFTPSLNRLLISLLTTEELAYTGLPNYVDAIFAVPEAVNDTVRIAQTSDLCPSGSQNLRATTNGATYSWSTGENSRSIVVTEPGTYAVTISGSCYPTVEEYTVETILLPEVDILPLDLLGACVGDSVTFTFQAEPPTSLITWPDGSSDSTFRRLYIPQDSFILRIATPCGRRNTSFIFPEETPFLADLATDFTPPLCQGDLVNLVVSSNRFPEGDSLANAGAVLWEDSSVLPNRSILADSNTVYIATVSSGCGDTILLSPELDYSLCPLDCEAAIPSLISPNRDGINDGFRVFSNCGLGEYRLRIFNRWGQLVFSSQNPNESWDGSKDGIAQPMDVYLYQVQFRFPNNPDLERRDGEFSLVR